MKELFESKLNYISVVWSQYLIRYKICNSKIKFTDDVKSNYIADIIRYFLDTFEIIYDKKQSGLFLDNFQSTISFLQAIYIQQDFIEELLFVFKCRINKGDLIKNENYSINRNIRNELIGHPIRKKPFPTSDSNYIICEKCGSIKSSNSKKDLTLLSSTILSNNLNSEYISYLLYHKDKGYKFEEINHKKQDILNRHNEFLNYYFELIINKLKQILKEFKLKIENIETAISNATFKNTIEIINHSFEEILKTNYLYKKESLLKIYNKRDEHKRYKNALNLFNNELKDSLIETKNNLSELIKVKSNFIKKTDISNINITYNSTENKINPTKQKVSFDYEMGKLIDKDNFEHIIRALRSKCKENKAVLSEINNMENNLNNDFEYYCSYYLISKILLDE